MEYKIQPDQINQKENPADPKAIASEEFIKRFYSTPIDDRKRYPMGELDIEPKELEESLNLLNKGELHITNFVISPGTNEGEIKYHFRLGRTDFHLRGKAVEDVKVIQQELQKNTSK